MVAKDKLYQLFSKYKSDIFIETGTHMGYGIERALDLGYEKIFSIEIMEGYYSGSVEKFQYDENVFLYYGDSAMHLLEILKRVNKRATFWLDAHMAGPGQPCPILYELKAIGEHKIKDHNILIDDVRDFGTDAHDYITIQQVQEALLKINFNYKFAFESSGIVDNVLVATI